MFNLRTCTHETRLREGCFNAGAFRRVSHPGPSDSILDDRGELSQQEHEPRSKLFVDDADLVILNRNIKIGTLLFNPWEHPIVFWRNSESTERAWVSAPKSVRTAQEVPSAFLI